MFIRTNDKAKKLNDRMQNRIFFLKIMNAIFNQINDEFMIF